MSVNKVIQYNVHFSSPEDAQSASDALALQEGYLEGEAHVTFGSQSAHAHFECPADVTQEMLPEGCRLVSASIVEYLLSRKK